MKTDLFEFKRNESQKINIAKSIINSISFGDIKEIDIIINELELNLCRHLKNIFMELKIETKKNNSTYDVFKAELNKFTKRGDDEL